MANVKYQIFASSTYEGLVQTPGATDHFRCQILLVTC